MPTPEELEQRIADLRREVYGQGRYREDWGDIGCLQEELRKVAEQVHDYGIVLRFVSKWPVQVLLVATQIVMLLGGIRGLMR